MDSIEVRNFRCFQSTGEIALKRLTILIGENSTGKSSFLAATRLAWDIAFSPKPIDFNEEPFLLGAYDQIAHYRGGRAGRAANFEVSSTISVRPPRTPEQTSSARIPLRFCTTFGQSGSHPVIVSQTLEYAGYSLSAHFASSETKPRVELRSPTRQVALPLADPGGTFRFDPESPVDWGFIIFFLTRRAEAAESTTNLRSVLTDTELSVLTELGRQVRSRRIPRPIALAPVRSRPLRTYNPVSATPLPEGEHIPMVLAKTFFAEDAQWTKLRTALHQFGKESGLFEDLEIKALGRSESEPFQIRVKIGGPAANLVDVGYGVSQVLPILVDSILSDRDDTFLLQQPEVHLHPRAQAALGSFLLRIAVEHGKRFVLETHSDYLIDRIRMEIRDSKRATPDDVSLLFLRRNGIQVDVHPMRLDEAGNLHGVPPDYREFFLSEERRLLGV